MRFSSIKLRFNLFIFNGPASYGPDLKVPVLMTPPRGSNWEPQLHEQGCLHLDNLALLCSRLRFARRQK